MKREFEDRVTQVLDRYLPAGAPLAVAFSGGADSLALLVACHAVLRRRGESVLALHCNFHLRGEESHTDAEFCRLAARRLGVPIETIDFSDVAQTARSNGESIEMACRRLRYNWFGQYTAKGYYIAVGHHLEDNRETFFLNLTRGTGLRGLCGMAPAEPERRLLRPLIGFTRSQIESYLQECGLEWRTDSTNLVADVGRNRLRLNVLPTLQENFPRAFVGIDATMEHLRDDYECLAEWLDNIIWIVTEGNVVDLDKLRTLTTRPQRVLFEILRSRGFSYSQCVDILAIKPATGYGVFEGTRCRVEANHVEARIVESAGDEEPATLAAPSLPALCALAGAPRLEMVETGRPLHDIGCRMDPEKAFFDADAFDALCARHGGVVWRAVCRGDSLRPYGMRGRRKLASDILTNLHASPAVKRAARVLAFAGHGEVLWLAPFRASVHCPVTHSTKRIYVLSI